MVSGLAPIESPRRRSDEISKQHGHILLNPYRLDVALRVPGFDLGDPDRLHQGRNEWIGAGSEDAVTSPAYLEPELRRPG